MNEQVKGNEKLPVIWKEELFLCMSEWVYGSEWEGKDILYVALLIMEVRHLE